MILTLAMVLCCFAACGGKTETDTTTEPVSEEAPIAAPDSVDGSVLELGNSGLVLTSDKKFEKGDISTEEPDENQVAYYYSEETLVDLDIYEWAKATE